jgi:hypothetical protein
MPLRLEGQTQSELNVVERRRWFWTDHLAGLMKIASAMRRLDVVVKVSHLRRQESSVKIAAHP